MTRRSDAPAWLGAQTSPSRPVWRLALLLLSLGFSSHAWAIDSYRYLHVTIDTPWLIFLFLLPAVLAPLILMVVLYWRFAIRRGKTEAEEKTPHE